MNNAISIKCIHKTLYKFMLLLSVLKLIHGADVKENPSDAGDINKKTRESKQILFADGNYYGGAYDFPTSLLVENNYDAENEKINNYAYQGGVNTVSGYNYYEQNPTKTTDGRDVDMKSNTTKVGDANKNPPENIDSDTISITTGKSVETTTKMTRESKDYAFPSGSGGSSDSVASGTNSANSNYKYPYPYPGSTDTGSSSAGYYYYHDDKNYWQTAPPAITSEKPMPGSTVLECHPSNPMPSGLGELFRVTGLAKVNVLKAVLTGILGLLILKIPALLILKAILFKVVLVPLGAISVLLPVILPMIYLWPNLASVLGITTTTTTTTTAAPALAPATNGTAAAAPATRTGKSLEGMSHDDDAYVETRAMPLLNARRLQEVVGNLVNSERCLERIACKLGARDSESNYRKHVAWILKRLQSMVDEDARRQFRLYRDAYNLGSSKKDICDKGHYPCEIPRLTLVQNSHSYRII